MTDTHRLLANLDMTRPPGRPETPPRGPGIPRIGWRPATGHEQEILARARESARQRDMEFLGLTEHSRLITGS